MLPVDGESTCGEVNEVAKDRGVRPEHRDDAPSQPGSVGGGEQDSGERARETYDSPVGRGVVLEATAPERLNQGAGLSERHRDAFAGDWVQTA